MNDFALEVLNIVLQTTCTGGQPLYTTNYEMVLYINHLSIEDAIRPGTSQALKITKEVVILIN
jgi:hypothetical protein